MHTRIRHSRFINLFGLKGVGATLAFCGPNQWGSLALARALTSWQTSATRSRDMSTYVIRERTNGNDDVENTQRGCSWRNQERIFSLRRHIASWRKITRKLKFGKIKSANLSELSQNRRMKFHSVNFEDKKLIENYNFHFKEYTFVNLTHRNLLQKSWIVFFCVLFSFVL